MFTGHLIQRRTQAWSKLSVLLRKRCHEGSFYIFKLSELVLVQGLDFLHTSPILVHGMLHASNCVVDSHWTVKLTDYGIESVVDSLIKHNEIKANDNKPIIKHSKVIVAG
jgi:serine/threonine protein kinase